MVTPTRVLVVAYESDGVVDWALQPFRDHRRALRRELGVRFDIHRADDLPSILKVIQSREADVVLVNTSWREPVAAVTELMVAARAAHPDAPLIYLDTFDQSSTPYFSILPHVDLYVKKQIFTDLDVYRRDDWIGGFPISDYFARHLGLDLGDWRFGSLLPPGEDHKLVLGWNLATAKYLRRDCLRRGQSKPFAERDIDVHCRVSYGDESSNWYAAHRRASIVALRAMPERFRVVCAGGDDERVPLSVFQDEMRRSRIGFSPFGWGELTDRDFGIINDGALLMKPDMSHLRTEPDIYRDGETYVAVRWDLADLEEKVDYWLARPEQAQRVIDRAREVMTEYSRGTPFVRRFGEILAAATVGAPT